jgi:predicted transcriptional regulator
MRTLTEEDRCLIVNDMLKALEDVRKEWPNVKKHRGGCVMSRAKIEQVWNALNPTMALSVAEIARDLKMSENVTQRALYTLLAEHRAQRQRRDGKLYEYIQTGEPSDEPLEPESSYYINALREAVPHGQENALTATDIAKSINANLQTTRFKLKLLLAAGEIDTCQGRTDKNIPVGLFYRR